MSTEMLLEGTLLSWILGPGWAEGQLRGLVYDTCQQGQSKLFLRGQTAKNFVTNGIIDFSLLFFSKILFDSIKCFSFINLFLWMEVIVEARVFRWRPSSLSSPSSLWPWTPGRRPGERQFDYFCMSKDALETVAARRLGPLWSSPSLFSLIFLPPFFPSPS